MLDYRDFLNYTIDRSQSILIHNESFVNHSGVDQMTPSDLADIGHHAHSDFDEDADEDPYYEYNKCHEYTKLELKDLSKDKF